VQAPNGLREPIVCGREQQSPRRKAPETRRAREVVAPCRSLRALRNAEARAVWFTSNKLRRGRRSTRRRYHTRASQRNIIRPHADSEPVCCTDSPGPAGTWFTYQNGAELTRPRHAKETNRMNVKRLDRQVEIPFTSTAFASDRFRSVCFLIQVHSAVRWSLPSDFIDHSGSAEAVIL